MLKCVAKVVMPDGGAIIQHCSIPGGYPFGKEECKKWIKEDIPEAISIEIYGPRSDKYKLYMKISGYVPRKP